MSKSKALVLLIAVLMVAGCVSQSAVLTNNTGQSVQCKNEGWGWLGAPIAAANQSKCVKNAEAAGYRVGGISQTTTVAQKKPPNAINVAFPAGWETQPLSESQRKAGSVLSAINKTSDSGLLISTISSDEIIDLDRYIISPRAAQESHLTGATHSDVTDISINGQPAKRFEVNGTTLDGLRLTYDYTLIIGKKQFVTINAWTSAANYADQKATLDSLAERVSGIE